MLRYRLGLIGCLLLMIIPITAQESDRPLPTLYTTHAQTSGNRLIDGAGTFPDVTRIDRPTTITAPQFLIAVPDVHEDDAQFMLSGDDQMQIFSLNDTSNLQAIDHAFVDALPRPVFAVTRRTDHTYDLLFNTRPTWTDFRPAAHTHLFPLPAADNGDDRYLAIADNGDLVYTRVPASGTRLENRRALMIQPDARIVQSRQGLFAVYTRATDQRYVHGIMGDRLEGAGLVVFAVNDDDLQIITQINLPGDAVYEGLSPLWADIDDDGRDDLVTTISQSRLGSRLRAYLLTDGGTTIEIDGPAIGQANRWQHQLAHAPFSPDGTPELVEVLTPHIGGVVRFYRFTGTCLAIVAQVRGYTSHVIGSRNLDLAVAGDFNGDGTPEIVLPAQRRDTIAGIQRTTNGAEVVWELPLGGTLATNLAAVRLESGLALAVATTDGHLRVWRSR